MPRHSHLTPRCPRCRLHVERCICALLPTVVCPTPVVVVQHWKEARKPTSTGSLVASLLERGSRRIYGDRDRPFDTSGLDTPGTWLVFPDRAGAAPAPEGVCRQLVLVDGNWNQASRMARRIPILAELPRLALTAPARPARRLREPPDPTACSTMEAAARALRSIGEATAADQLEALHDVFVMETLRQRGIPGA